MSIPNEGLIAIVEYYDIWLGFVEKLKARYHNGSWFDVKTDRILLERGDNMKVLSWKPYNER